MNFLNGTKRASGDLVDLAHDLELVALFENAHNKEQVRQASRLASHRLRAHESALKASSRRQRRSGTAGRLTRPVAELLSRG